MGLQLTLSALVLIGASRLFGGIAEDVVTGDPLTVVDVLVADGLHVRVTPAITRLMLVKRMRMARSPSSSSQPWCPSTSLRKGIGIGWQP